MFTNLFQKDIKWWVPAVVHQTAANWAKETKTKSGKGKDETTYRSKMGKLLFFDPNKTKDLLVGVRKEHENIYSANWWILCGDAQ